MKALSSDITPGDKITAGGIALILLTASLGGIVAMASSWADTMKAQQDKTESRTTTLEVRSGKVEGKLEEMDKKLDYLVQREDDRSARH